jgi:hypothetical protein
VPDLDITAMSDKELQRLYWAMKLDTREAVEFTTKIAQELNLRTIGAAEAIEDMNAPE